MSLIAVNDVHLNVQVCGEGQPLVLLHGFTGSIENWRPHIQVFKNHLQVVALDLLGHGESDAPADPARYGLAPCLADLVAVLDHLGLPQTNVLGYSMGGRVALHLAAAHPQRVRALVLESASPGLADPVERRERQASDEALAAGLERGGLEAFINHWERLPLFASQRRLPEATRAALRAQRLRNRALGLANSLRGLGTGAQPSLWDRLSGLQTPTLLLAGELDPKFVALSQAMAEALPRARLAIVPHAGHTIHLEQPEMFQRLVVRWLLEI